MSMSKFATQADYWKDRAEKAEAALIDLGDHYAKLSGGMWPASYVHKHDEAIQNTRNRRSPPQKEC